MKHLFLPIFISVLALFTLTACQVACNCTEVPQNFRVDAVQADGVVFKWDAQPATPAFKLTIADNGSSLKRDYSFSQNTGDLPQKKITFDEFFKKGKSYAAFMINDCNARQSKVRCRSGQTSGQSNVAVVTP